MEGVCDALEVNDSRLIGARFLNVSSAIAEGVHPSSSKSISTFIPICFYCVVVFVALLLSSVDAGVYYWVSERYEVTSVHFKI